MNSKQKSSLNGTADQPNGLTLRFAARNLLPIAVLVIISLAVYHNSLSNGFVFDDYAVIVENKHIKDLSNNLPSFFNNSYFKMVAGEASEWETYLYANDATTLGKNKAVIFVGHIKSEEAGMDYCAQWLKGFVKGVPVHFIENEANFVTFCLFC